MRWLLVGLLCVGAGISVMGVQMQSARVLELSFMLETALLLATAVTSATASLVLSIPGEDRGVLQRAFPVIPFFFWMALLIYRYLINPETPMSVLKETNFDCVGALMSYAFAPAALLLYMIIRAAPTRPGWSGLLALIAACALAAAGLQFSCPARSPAHLLLWHLLPTILIGLVGICLGKKLLRW